MLHRPLDASIIPLEVSELNPPPSLSLRSRAWSVAVTQHAGDPKADFLSEGDINWHGDRCGFGTVYLAIDLTNHEEVAVKLESQNGK